MVVTSMLLSGAMAGLVGMPTLLNDTYKYGTDFPAGIGFTGIAIALLGRNNPVGIALGALLWGFLERTGTSWSSRATTRRSSASCRASSSCASSSRTKSCAATGSAAPAAAGRRGTRRPGP